MLRSKNIEVLLVYAPVSKNLFTSYTNTSFYDSIMASYENYINFNYKLKLNDTLHFYDSDHLNQKGVQLFNNELIKYIDSLFPKKNKKTYKKWVINTLFKELIYK